MSLNELYQEIILDHGKKPRNFGSIDEATHSAEGYNPLCGDQVHVYVVVEGDVITDLKFEGCGCAISTASASIMTQAVRGKTLHEAEELFRGFHEIVTGEREPDEDLGEMAALIGVRQFPTRIKCATLCWHALHSALHDKQKASTE